MWFWLKCSGIDKIYNITVVTNVVNNKSLTEILPKVKLVNLNIQREISYFSDLTCFIKLVTIFITNRYNLVFSITPKGGFLSMFASYAARIKNRVHWYGGQVWVTRTGFQRFFLRNVDRLMGFLATHVLTDSKSQKKFLEDENIIKKGRLEVLANGSICGVDTNQFKPDPELWVVKFCWPITISGKVFSVGTVFQISTLLLNLSVTANFSPFEEIDTGWFNFELPPELLNPNPDNIVF